MKFEIHPNPQSIEYESTVLSSLKHFESLRIPIHNRWKRDPKIVIQSFLKRIILEQSGKIWPEIKRIDDFSEWPKRLRSTLSGAQFGNDVSGKKFIILPIFIHSNGTEKVLLALQTLYNQRFIDYVILFVVGKELKRITDGIMSSELTQESMDCYRAVFTMPLLLVEIEAVDFFDMRTYRHDKQFWETYLKDSKTFQKMLTEHPIIKREIGLG